MNAEIDQSAAVQVPSRGISQVAYVTNDFDRAQWLFAETHGITRFFEMRDICFPTIEGREAKCHIGLAYVGGVEIEIIQPLDGDVALYRDCLPQDGFGVRFHHICKLYENNEAYDREVRSYRERGLRFPIDSGMQGSRFFYVDMRNELGHYVEGVVFSKETRAAMLAAIPRY
jgi:hypothetical protein